MDLNNYDFKYGCSSAAKDQDTLIWDTAFRMFNLLIVNDLLQVCLSSINQIVYSNVAFTLSIMMLQSSFGFIDYYDRRYAALAILSLNGRQL